MKYANVLLWVTNVMVDLHACLHNCAVLGMWEKMRINNETKKDRINDLPKKNKKYKLHSEKSPR